MPAESNQVASPAKKALSVLLLPAIAVLLIAYFVLFERDSDNALKSPRTSRHLFSGLDMSSAERIEVSAGEKRLVVSVENGQFRLLHPSAGDANQDEVARLLSILSSAEYQRILPLEQAGGGLAQFGLQKPRLIVEVRLKPTSEAQSRTITVHFGRRSPSRAHVYAILPGNKEVLIMDARIVDQITYFLHVPPVDRPATNEQRKSARWAPLAE